MTDPFPEAQKAHLSFTWREVNENFPIHTDAGIEVLQLSRVPAFGTGLPDAALGGWCRLLNEAQYWHEVPAILNNPVLDEAMARLHDFRKDNHLNTIYRGRLSYALERGMIEHELRDAKAELEEERAAKEAERAAKEAERAAKEAERAAKEAALKHAAALAAELAALRAKLGS